MEINIVGLDERKKNNNRKHEVWLDNLANFASVSLEPIMYMGKMYLRCLYMELYFKIEDLCGWSKLLICDTHGLKLRACLI